MTSLGGSFVFWVLATGLLVTSVAAVASAIEWRRPLRVQQPSIVSDSNEMAFAIDRLDRLTAAIGILGRQAEEEALDLRQLKRELMYGSRAPTESYLAEVLSVVQRLLEYNESMRQAITDVQGTVEDHDHAEIAPPSGDASTTNATNDTRSNQPDSVNVAVSTVEGVQSSSGSTVTLRLQVESATPREAQAISGNGERACKVEHRAASSVIDWKAYQRAALMAPYVLPPADMLKPIQCREVNSKSIRFHSEQPPQSERLVLRLPCGGGNIDVSARVVNWEPLNEDGEDQYLVECDFVGKVSL